MLNIEYKIKVRSVFRQTVKMFGEAFKILADTIRGFLAANAAASAASIAYYTLFSFFPLLILLVGFVSSVLKDEPVQQLVLNAVAESLPTAQDLVKGNIERALNISGTVQIAGTIGLLWSATGVFNALAQSINRAWHTAPTRNFLFGRLVALAMVASLTALLILWVLSTTVFNLFPWLEVPIFGDIVIYDTYAWRILSRLVPYIVIFALFLNLYRWVPNTKVRWREALWGAGISALGWELANTAFALYLGGSLARYQLIYGSLGALIALMLWIYLSSMIVLFGAHLSATVAAHTRLNRKKSKKRRAVR
jgi:membrane protein